MKQLIGIHVYMKIGYWCVDEYKGIGQRKYKVRTKKYSTLDEIRKENPNGVLLIEKSFSKADLLGRAACS